MDALKKTRASGPDSRWESLGEAAKSTSRLRLSPSMKVSPMQKQAPVAPRSAQPLWVVVLSAGLIVGVAMGLRQVMGLYLPPMTTALGIGVAPFSNAMAVANLIWGVGAVFAGMIADRYGAGRVVVVGTLATVAGLSLRFDPR